MEYNKIHSWKCIFNFPSEREVFIIMIYVLPLSSSLPKKTKHISLENLQICMKLMNLNLDYIRLCFDQRHLSGPNASQIGSDDKITTLMILLDKGLN